MSKEIRKVEFEVTWLMSGTQELELPDSVDIRDRKAVVNYISENFASVLVPKGGDYVPDSMEFDGEGPLRITLQSDPNYDWIDTGEIDYQLRWQL